MKTTIKVSLRYAQIAYEAITDNRYLEENVCIEHPDMYIIEEEIEEKHEDIICAFISQLDYFGINESEFEIITE